MIPAERPPDEYDRLAELHDLRLLDNPPEERFDRITRLAQRTFGTSIAAFSLVDEDRQYFMSRIGLPVSETPRDQAFCAHAILGDEVMVVPDASADERFHDNPLVTGDPSIHFYAGAPVRTESGHALGTLCVIDSRPHDWTDEDSAALADLARLVERELGGSRHEARHEALVALATISALTSDDPHQLLREALQVARDYLEMPIAAITSWEGDEAVVTVSHTADGSDLRGQRLPRQMTLAGMFDDPEGVHAVSRLSQSPLATHPIHTQQGIECLIGTVLSLDGRTVGSLAFASTRPLSYGEFTEDEVDFMRLLAHWVEGVLLRARQDEDIRRRSALLSLIGSAQSRFIGSADRHGAFEALLTDILELTGCEYGFIAERLVSDDGRPYLRTRAITNIAWNEETTRLYEAAQATGMIFDNPNTLFGITMMTGEPVISNDPASDPRSGGRPGHHPDLDSYLGLPLVIGTDVVGMIGLANKPSGFSADDLEYLQPLATTVAQLITVVRAQEAHRADQAQISRLSTVVRQMGTGVLITDLEGRMEWANAAFEAMFGFAGSDLIGMRPRDVFHGPGTDSATEDFIREAMERREPFIAELQVMRRNSERFWVALDSTPLLDEAGVPEGFVVLVDDITERKRVERMKSEFISTVSHELRTPLTSISGSLSLVGSGSVGELSERAQRMITIAQQNSQRLTLLINDLLDLEKLVEGGLPIEAEPHPIMALVERAVVDNQGYATRFGATIEIRSWLDDAVVHVDSVRFIQVMSNLLSNAAKYSPSGGVVAVDVRGDDDTITVEVSDEGPGVPEDFRDRVFDKFAQADATDSRARAGTGLGLAISKELVERMGGQIGYRTSADSGSVFWFSLPRVTDRRRGIDRRATGE